MKKKNEPNVEKGLYDNAYFWNCESLKIVSKNYTKRDEVDKAEKFVLCDVRFSSYSLQHNEAYNNGQKKNANFLLWYI